MIAKEYNGITYGVHESVLELYPTLVDMVLSSSLIEEYDRQYWISSLGTMTDEERLELENILSEDNAQYDAYEQSLQKRAEDIVIETEKQKDLHVLQERARQRKQEEAQSQSEDHEQADTLLSSLEDM